MANKTEDAWKAILEEYPILETVEKEGQYHILAEDIGRFREARLMTKHDCSESVPSPLKRQGLNVLPISRREYTIGRFELFEPFPEELNLKTQYFSLSELETLTLEFLTSEANATNALVASGILDSFLDSSPNVSTFNGRMGSGDFEFYVKSEKTGRERVSVRGAQIEIDGGYENKDSIVILEAKNIEHKDFQVRQLYYPFRRYASFVHKPIRLVFSQYTNYSFRLFEYEFLDPEDFNSLQLQRMGVYSLEDPHITWNDLDKLCSDLSDYPEPKLQGKKRVFPQANSFPRLLSVLEFLYGNDGEASKEDVHGFMGVEMRQVDYYMSAGEYLGLIDRSTRAVFRLTPVAKKILGAKARERSLGLARQLFQHEIFRRIYRLARERNAPLSKKEIIPFVEELGVLSGDTVGRRSDTVRAWMQWLMDLVS